MFSRPIDVVEVRPDLRRRAEEPRPVGRHAGDHPRRPAGAVAEVAAHDAELRGARRERLDVQHAAVLRHLPDGPGDEVGAGAGRPRRDRRAQRAQGRRSSTPRSIAPASTAAPPTRRSRSRMNITFRLPSEELEEQVREGIDRRRPRRPQGPPLGRRHARVDLQRVPGRRRRRARRRSCRSSRRRTARASGSSRRDRAVERRRRPLESAAATAAPAARRRRGGAGLAVGGAGLASARRCSASSAERLDEALPVLEHRRRVAVDLEPRQRVLERAAVHQRALGARRHLQVGDARLQRQHLAQPLGVAARDRQRCRS